MMTMAKFIMTIMTAFSMLLLGGCYNSSASVVEVREDLTKREMAPTAATNGIYSIYLITMDQVSNYWQRIDAGCRSAVRDIGGIEYHWTAPLKNDVTKQKQCIEQAIEAGADAILLSAASATELEDALKDADKAGVKLVYVDSAANHDAVAALGTDNEAAGRKAAEVMKRALSEAGVTNGTIGIAIGSTKGKNGVLRERGFLAGFQETDFKVGPTVAQNGNPENIKAYMEEHPEYVAFFGANEQTTKILSEQVQLYNVRPIIIGFDTSDFTLSMIQQGVIYATIKQNTEKMGYEGISVAMAALKGEYKNNGAEIDTGVSVITKDKL